MMINARSRGLAVNKPQVKENKFLYYILVFLTLTIETDPFFNQTRVPIFLLFALLGTIFLYRGHEIEKKWNFLFLIVAGLIIIQGALFGFKLLTLVTYTALRLLLPYFLYRIIGVKIWKYLVNIIYFFSITSLFFWFLQNAVPPFDSFMQNLKDTVFLYSFDLWPRSLILYTVAMYDAGLGFIEIYRNSGIFHEPGAYSIWLTLGIGANTIITGKHFNKKNIVMAIALLTTFATAGYLQFFVLLFFLVARSRMNIVFRMILFLLFIFSSIYVYTSASFMSEKITTKYQNETSLRLEGAVTTGRFVRALKIVNVIQQSPIIGRGIITASAEEDELSAYYVSGTGSLKIFAHFGLIFGFLFFLYYYRGILLFIKTYGYNGSFAKYLLAALLVGGFTQDLFFDAVSVQFFFIGFFGWVEKKKLKRTKKKPIRYRPRFEPERIS